MCISVVGVCPEAHAIVQYLVETEFKLETVVLHLTLVDVGVRGCTVVRRYRTVASRDEDIFTVIAEIVETTCKHTTEDSIVKTDVLFHHRCPSEVRVGNHSFLISFERAFRAVKTHVKTLSIVRYFPSGQISPTGTTGIITNLTDRTTDFEHINNLLIFQLLHEFLFREHPA